MDDVDHNMSEIEFLKYKADLRQKAYEKEIVRQKKKTRQIRNSLRVTIAALVVLVVLLFLLRDWVFPAKEVVVREEPVTIIDTLYLPVDTVYMKSDDVVVFTDYFTIQVGAYTKATVPKFLEKSDLPIIHYKSNDVLCYGFGQFETLDEAKAAKRFLVSIGFRELMIVQMDGKERVGILE